MTEDQELAALCQDFEGWRIWRGRDVHGQLAGWHATLRGTRRASVIVAADGAAELRQRLEQMERKHAAEVTHV